MTVALIVLRPRTGRLATLLIPVAVEAVYARIWMAGAADVGAVWLPLFQTGCDVAGDDFAAVTDELTALRGWVATQPLPANRKEQVIGRIDLLIDGLSTLISETNGDVLVFIG